MKNPDRRAVIYAATALTALPLPVFAAQSKAGSGSSTQASTALAPRERILFDFDWRFALGHAADVNRDFGFGRDQKTYAKQGKDEIAEPARADFDAHLWQAVDLPHDWAVTLPFARNDYFIPPENPEDGDPGAGHGYKAIGRRFPENSIGWYRKVFDLTAADANKTLTLEFDGVFRDALIILNGYILTRHESGYTPFNVDITSYINTSGPNILLVRTDASLGEGWFYEGAGIYRHVWLVKTHKVHIPQWGVCVRGETSGAIALETAIKNASGTARTLDLVSQIYDGAGRPAAKVSSSLEVPAFSEGRVAQSCAVANPKLWNLDDPHLYTARCEIWEKGECLDVYTARFGLRDIRFDAKDGFFLNGKGLKIRGANNHEDHAGVGTGVPDALHFWRVKELKDMGANAWRCAHNMPSEAILNACDELGMLVIDETRLMTATPEGLSQLETLIRRDRNHPSVILWSIGNEETAQQGTERGLKIATEMRRLIKSLDPTRPITAAMNHYQGQGITPALDVMGFNYHESSIEPFRKLYPDMPIIGTETASAVSTRGEYVRDEVKGYVRAYDLDAPSYALTASAWWSLYNAKPYLSGGLVWTGFDYRGEPTPFNRWPEISSHFGILDTCGFPKDIYYYYKAWWQSAPVLHLLPHWTWQGREGQPIDVWAYSNLDRVELFLNKRSLGVQTVPKDGHVQWTVPYVPGELVAYGFKGEKVVMKTSRRTAGLATRLTITSDRAELRTDGQDIVLVRAELFDQNGTPLPTADNLIQFAVSGPARIAGVGNGNPTSLEADQASSRHLFNGLAQAVVRARRAASPAPVVITASTDGLPTARLSLTAHAD
ncbi:beta-galactosidase GalA [Asticcacaulis sp. 201]|uniref:beta-galactosidase GalA n=1 Tax=Asticcacaulis sp. 201 TaxID=3028787 RepID=UPI002915C8CC|nr:beta-galactosidase GalA [Asticcacaulis sp. 201]MDV6330895.1 beta-galactosidase GalA [Asticcacaulis sp. 201]